MYATTHAKFHDLLDFEEDYIIQYMPGTVGFFSMDGLTELAHIRLNGPAPATYWVNAVD
jgi:hypothetical protein